MVKDKQRVTVYQRIDFAGLYLTAFHTYCQQRRKSPVSMEQTIIFNKLKPLLMQQDIFRILKMERRTGLIFDFQKTRDRKSVPFRTVLFITGG